MTVNFPEFPTAGKEPISPAATEALGHRATVERGGIYARSLKRLFDIAAVVITAPVTVPIVAVLAVFVAQDGGSPFYCQERVGKGRRPFRLWKLRSMVVDADARMEACLAADPLLRQEWNQTQKLKADPRITRVGRLLRKSSLDELPQLWNVLIGDMSLVGPRPMMTSQQALYPGQAYYALRPGLTGYWQISERNESSFADRAGYDDRYERDVSLATDIRVLFATLRAVARGTGY
jgi:lipopolysaccharide/colanic/teichoic acid biosynthesis glycosyltransferase